MKRLYQERTDVHGEEVRVELRFNQGESLAEGLAKALLVDLSRAIGLHDTILIIRRRELSDDVQVGDAPSPQPSAPKPDASTVFKRILEVNNLDKKALANLMGGQRLRQISRWLDGSSRKPNTASCKLLIQLHAEGKLKIPENVLHLLHAWSARGSEKT